MHTDQTFFSDNTVRAVRRRLLRWGRRNYKEFPWRRPDQLWHALIAEILLQRTRAKNVIPVYENFITRFPTVDSLKGITLEAIEQIIYPLGLRWRAPLIKELCDSAQTTRGRFLCCSSYFELPPGTTRHHYRRKCGAVALPDGGSTHEWGNTA
jgi:A/G-specific adenine glycosylase